jgi:FkbM family methyltransferase
MRGPFVLNPPCDLERTAALYVHSDNDIHVSRRIAEEGIWEDYETRLILDMLQTGDRFVDVGANLGYYSILAAIKTGPEGKVFAFEPEQKNFDLLKQNVLHNDLQNVDIFCAALSDNDAQGQLFLNDENRGDHQIYAVSGEQRYQQDITLRNGDRLLRPLCERIDVLKVDTQGAEWHVLSGLKTLISDSLPAIRMVVEFCPYSLRHAGASGMQLLDLLSSFGLPFFIIDHIGHGLIPASRQDLADWVASVDADPDNQGFINLLLGSP